MYGHRVYNTLDFIVYIARILDRDIESTTLQPALKATFVIVSNLMIQLLSSSTLQPVLNTTFVTARIQSDDPTAQFQ